MGRLEPCRDSFKHGDWQSGFMRLHLSIITLISSAHDHIWCKITMDRALTVVAHFKWKPRNKTMRSGRGVVSQDLLCLFEWMWRIVWNDILWIYFWYFVFCILICGTWRVLFFNTISSVSWSLFFNRICFLTGYMYYVMYLDLWWWVLFF